MKDNLREKAGEQQKLKTTHRNILLDEVKKSCKSIEQTKDPTLKLVRMQLPLAEIREAFTHYFTASDHLKESGKILSGTLNDIQTTLSYYSGKLSFFSKEIELEKVKYSHLLSIQNDREYIVSSIKYGVKAYKETKDIDEKNKIADNLRQELNANRIYIEIINRVFSIENERRREKGVKVELDLIQPITSQEVGLTEEGK